MASRNVLVTKRRHDADPNDPKTNNPILIDFEKGLDAQIWQKENSVAIDEDVKAYGELSEQLAILWMEDTGHYTVPLRLIDVMRRCKAEQPNKRPTMRQVVTILEELEQDIEQPDLTIEEVKEIGIEDAWNVPDASKRPSRRQRNSASFTPNYRRFQRAKKNPNIFNEHTLTYQTVNVVSAL